MKNQTEGQLQNTIAVFIDFENIYYSSLNNYGEEPDLMIIRNLCEKKGGIASIQVFGDWFNNEQLTIKTVLNSCSRVGTELIRSWSYSGIS